MLATTGFWHATPSSHIGELVQETRNSSALAQSHVFLVNGAVCMVSRASHHYEPILAEGSLLGALIRMRFWTKVTLLAVQCTLDIPRYLFSKLLRKDAS